MIESQIKKHLEKAEEAMDSDNLEEAARKYQLILKFFPFHLAAWSGISKVFRQRNELNVLLSLYDQFIDRCPVETQALFFGIISDLLLSMEITDSQMSPNLNELYHKWASADLKVTPEKYLKELQETQKRWNEHLKEINFEVTSLEQVLPLIKEIELCLYFLVQDSKDLYQFENLDEMREGYIKNWEELVLPAFNVVNVYLKNVNFNTTDMELFTNFCFHDEQFMKVLESIFISYYIADALDVE